MKSLAVGLMLLVSVSCAGGDEAGMKQYPYEKIPPESWRQLEVKRDAYAPIVDLETLYDDHTHPNGLPYHLYVPGNIVAGEAYPLVVFLHGMTDTTLGAHRGVPKGIWSLPFVQDPHPHVDFIPRHRTENDNWTHDTYREMVIQAIDDLIIAMNGDSSSPNIDTDRVYLTGFSQGGMATWEYIRKYPDKFAAAAPLSGFFNGPQNESEAREIIHIPVWIFNGSRDDGVEGSRISYQALKAAGARDVRYHEYLDHGHVIDDIAYFSDGFMDWLFSQRRTADDRED
jgi:predicted peptidase